MIDAPVHLLREGTDDLAMWNEVHVDGDYKLVESDVKDKIVLDIGGGVGAFAALCAQLGALKVISVEPNASTCDTYRNVMRYELTECRAVLVEGAAWSSDGVGELRMNGGHRGCDSLINDLPERTSCRLIRFQSLIDEWRPSCVKIDAEWSEYELLSPLPHMPSVQTMWVEFHETKRAGAARYRQMVKIVGELVAVGFVEERIKNEDGVVYRFRRRAPR